MLIGDEILCIVIPAHHEHWVLISRMTLFCDFSSSWNPHPAIFDRHGYKWPDDFDDAETGLLFISETNANRIITLPVGIGLSGAINLRVREVSGQWSAAVKIPKGTSPDQPAAALDPAGTLYVFMVLPANEYLP